MSESTSMDRVLTTLQHREPDRVPLFLLPTIHGALHLGLPIREYFSRAEHVAEGQLRMRARYGHDCLYGFFYAAAEVEAWGAEVVFAEDGPPTTGEPFLRSRAAVATLSVPDVERTPCLARVLRAISLMKEKVGTDAPIIGVAMSPFSLPVMQMGFAQYLDLMLEEPELFDRLMKVNEEFCAAWANAQLQAGATAICYFDPVSSTTIIPPELYLRHGQPVATRTIARIHGPTATHFASGRCLPIVDAVVRTGTAVVGVGSLEDFAAAKAACRGKVTVLGNLPGIQMTHWTTAQAEDTVRQCMAAAAPGGGFILSDGHGELPLQVADETLLAIAAAVREWGRYPVHAGVARA
jgi:uroporphyrinogen decarboxylase